jgi:aconitase B
MDPGLESADLRGLDQEAAEALCNRIAATAALDEVRERAKQGISRAKGILGSADFTDEERELLGMIADGVVERYA